MKGNRLRFYLVFSGCLLYFWCGALSAQEALELNNTGVEAFNNGDYSRAIRLLEQALSLDSESPVVRRNLCNAYQNRANTLAQSRDFNGAVKYLQKAIKTDPENISPLVQLGSYHLTQDRVSDAISCLEEAIGIKPGDLDAHELLGQAYYEDNDLYSARIQWDYVLAVDPNRPGLKERYEKAFREESVEYEFNKWKANHFNISYPPETPAALRNAVSSILDRAYLDIGRALGSIFPPSPVQVVLYSFEQFGEATRMDDHIGAVYDGKIRSPLTDARGNWLSEDELKRRLVHEYVHVVTRQMAGERVPWWLNEGLAETLSKPISQEEINRLREIYGNGRAISLKEMETAQMQRRSPDALREAYLQAHATVDMLWNRYGRTKMVSFLRELGKGTESEKAFQSAYRRTFATCESEVATLYGY